MENKFEDELIKIEKLLNKVDEDLKVDNPKEDYNLFFKNVDKTFEIYNICLEELCGQLYLLELSSHSKVYRKLYHHYKHQLYNIMKFQLSLQKDLNDKIEEEKSYKSKIDILMNKVKNLKDKKSNLDNVIEEQKMKIEKLIIQNNEQNKKQQMKQKQLHKRQTEQDIRFQSTSKTMEFDQIMQSDINFENNYQDILNQVEEIQNDENNMDPRLKNNLQKLLQDIENQKKKYQDIKNQQGVLEKYSSLVQFDNQMQTSFIVYSEEQYQYLLQQMEQQKEEYQKEKQEFISQKAQDAAEIEENKRQLKQFQFKMDQLQLQITDLEQENNQHKLDIDNYQEQKQIFEQQITTLESSIQNESKEKQFLRKQVTQLEDINNTFQQEIENIAEKEHEINNKEEEIRHLYTQNSEFQERLKQLEDMELQRDVKLEKNVELLISNKNKKIEMYENELNKVIKEKKKHELQIEEIENQKQEIQENFTNLCENYQNQTKIIAQLKAKLNQQKHSKPSVIKKEKSSIINREKSQKVSKKDSKIKMSKKVKINTVKNIQKQGLKNKNQKKSQEKVVKNNQKEQHQKQSQMQQHQESIQQLREQHLSQTQNDIQQASYQDQYNSQSQATISEEKNISQKQSEQSSNTLSQRKSGDKYSSNEDIDSYSNSEYINESSQRMNEDEQITEKSVKNQNFKKFMQKDQKQDQNIQEEEQLQNVDNQPIQDVSIPPVSITCNRGIITDYSSPVQYIIDEKDLVFCRETDFEKIKECIDILAKIIGFDNLEDLNGAGNKDKQDNENQTLLKKTISGKDNGNKILPRFQNNLQQPTNKSRLDFKRQSRIEEDESIQSNDQSKENIESEYDLDKFEKELNQKPNVYVPNNLKQRKQTKTSKIQKSFYQDQKDVIEQDNQQDYVVERKKIIQNDNNQEQIEVVEYIRIPKELTVKKSILNPIFMKSRLKKVRTFEERLLNEFERNQREKEKIYFQMYLNIKNRYRFKPETLIKYLISKKIQQMIMILKNFYLILKNLKQNSNNLYKFIKLVEKHVLI